MYPNAFFPKKVRWFRKGYFPYLILYVLRDKPMHGYEISKAISEYCKGIYCPSPGSLYPTLKRLEREGYISAKIVDDRKVYSITNKGLSILRKKEEYLKDALSEISTFLDERMMKLIKSIRSLMRTFYIYLPDLTSEKVEAICEVLREARIKIQSILEGEEY